MKAGRVVGLIILGILFFLPGSLAEGAETIPEEFYIHGVIGHPQTLSLSCEARSAVDWAAFWGVKIRERKFLVDLPRSDNPDTGFVGDPNDPWGNLPPKSYGVHAKPVADLLRKYGLQAEARKGVKWKDVQAEISAGHPVIVWVVGQMWPGSPVRYFSKDGKNTRVAGHEHTMILVGYNPNVVYGVDAYSGKTLAYSKNAFLKSWATLGQMVIVGQRKKAEPPLVTQKANPGKFPLLFLPLIISQHYR
jgi:uncharacterized protein YvpB